MQVRRTRLDRIASVTRNVKLSRDVMMGDEVVSKEGNLLAVRILTNKYNYNTIEDVNGRMIPLRKGDTIAGVLGFRMALKGYAGVVPESLSVGDTIQVLNLGGVLGLCTAMNPELGAPFDAEVLGSVLTFPTTGDRVGRPSNIHNSLVQASESLKQVPPVIFVAGTSMNSGKTVAATEIVRVLTHRGKRVVACKLTGVSLMRDILAMKDAGAETVYDFTDAGVVSTRGAGILPIARGMLNRLAQESPDIIVAELGDGILGEYGVSDILADAEMMKAAACHVVCAPDPVAIYGAHGIYKDRFQLPIHVVAGPVTDNMVGRDYVEKQLGLPAHNARYDIDGLVDVVMDTLDEGGES